MKNNSAHRPYTILVLAVALGLSAFFFFRRPPVALQSKKQPYNLILVSIDTVRTDSLQIYNQNGAPTPALNRIAEKAFVFNAVISQVPFTLPSHCTMLTGTYPMKHLVQENTHDRLSGSAVTLAEVLKSRGYRTAGFVGSIVLDSSVGIDQGFDSYDDVFSLSDVRFSGLAGVQKSAGDVYRSFRRWFDGKEPGKFFAFVHFYDAHDPYEPPDPFRPSDQTPANLYKGELSYVDSVIGKMFDDLARQGVWQNTILVITGDHGEMFGEHNETGHGYYVYQQVLRVPLVIVVPGQDRKVVLETPVQIVDLMPTLLSLLAIRPPEEVQGQSFEPLLEGRKLSRFAYSESLSGAQNFGTAPLRCIQDADFKYIDSARPELYNIVEDPLETKNLVLEKKDLAGKMKLKLSQMVTTYSADPKEAAGERNLTAEQEEQFAALGYIGSTGGPTIHSNLDAKDYINYWNDLIQANTLVEDRRYSEAVMVLEKMRKANALPMSGEILLARSYAGLGQCDIAVPALQHVLGKDPDNLTALNTIAECYERAGSFDKAVETYRSLVEKHGSILALEKYARRMIAMGKQAEVLSYIGKLQKEGKLTEKYDSTLGAIYVDLNQPDQAIELLQKSVESNPEGYRDYLLLSGAYEQKGDNAKALSILEATGGKFQQPDFLFQLGLLYHKTGNSQKEMDTFSKMTELYREEPRGYFYLGKLLLDHGGPYDKVLELALRGLELKPSRDLQIFGNYLAADALANLGKEDQAGSYYEKANDLSQQHGETNDENK